MLVTTFSPGTADQYISRIMGTPILSREEETYLAKKLIETNCMTSAQKLITSHLRFVVFIANKYSGYHAHKEDLIQEGTVGLMKAVKKFNPFVGVRLATFAVHYIKAEIFEFILRTFRCVRIATTKAQRKVFFNLRSLRTSMKWLSDDEARRIAEELNVSISDVLSMEKKMHSSDLSFDPLVDDEEEGLPLIPSEYLCRDEDDPLNKCLADEHAAERSALVSSFNSLNARARDIIESRWLSDQPATLRELSEKYKISGERVRQLETQAFRDLKRINCI